MSGRSGWSRHASSSAIATAPGSTSIFGATSAVSSLQFRMQVHGLALSYVNFFGELRMTGFANFNIVGTGPHMHRFVIVRSSGVGAVHEYLGILDLGVDFYFAPVRMIVITAPVRSTPIRRAPVRAPAPTRSNSNKNAGGRCLHRRDEHCCCRC